MNRPTRWIALSLFVATCAAGCGTENPTGPSFARTEPAMETAVSSLPVDEDPSTSENTTMPDANPVDRNAKSNNGNHYGHDNDGNHYGLDN